MAKTRPTESVAPDSSPTQFVYALAQNWQALSYYRLDPAGITGAAALATLKHLAPFA